MLGLPKNTEIRKPLNKTVIYKRFNLTSAEQQHFDEDFSRLYIVNEISPFSVNVAEGDTVKSIFVVQAILKRKNYDAKNAIKLFKLIDSKIVLALQFENEISVAVFRNKLIKTDWTPSDSFELKLVGLNLDVVWENLITQIGSIEIERGHSLDEQIVADERKAKLQKEIARLEKQARAEKQPKKKFEIVQQIKKLKDGEKSEKKYI